MLFAPAKKKKKRNCRNAFELQKNFFVSSVTSAIVQKYAVKLDSHPSRVKPPGLGQWTWIKKDSVRSGVASFREPSLRGDPRGPARNPRRRLA